MHPRQSPLKTLPLAPRSIRVKGTAALLDSRDQDRLVQHFMESGSRGTRAWFGKPGTAARRGLPERLVTLDCIGEAIASAHRRGHDLVLLLVGLDVSAGAPGGPERGDQDTTMLEVTDRLRVVLAGAGTVMRVSDNTFAVMMAGKAATTLARRWANGILDTLARLDGRAGARSHADVAIGASAFPKDATRPDVLLERAEQALAAARRAGPNAFRSVPPRSRSGTDADTLIRERLDGAVARNELVLHYQPKIDLATGHVSGAEALVRWHHPELGLVEPARFIPLAEASGLIAAIGDWVLHGACDQVRRWRAQGITVPVGVNVSARQFRETDVAARILEVLRAHDVDPKEFEVELTESAVMDDAATVIDALDRLKAKGVRIAIDDFGTGYSSLSYLMHLPVDVVKIDRSYVRDVVRRQDNGATVRAIIRFARTLGMDVIAEGVESGAEADSLKQWGCQHAQGYFFGRPMSAEAFASKLGIGRRPVPSAT